MGIDWKDNGHTQSPREAGRLRNGMKTKAALEGQKETLGNSRLTKTLEHHHSGDRSSTYLRPCSREGASDWSGLGHTACSFCGRGVSVTLPPPHYLQCRCPEYEKHLPIGKRKKNGNTQSEQQSEFSPQGSRD